MARSRLHTPMFSHTTCRSERFDKTCWHRRWRAHERCALATASPEDFEEHLTCLAREASNPWNMGKDGRSYWPLSEQTERAECLANQDERLDPRERSSRKEALLAKWMAK
ncbi:hypothetical protein CCR95_00105 [Thiocystis minor]|uniref:hypothetical protein n=1 Tax=Thiocystis minor TaxID=61597 RepID=UPI001913635C|nr:hypothetical protein [Thiocystis minor]MBK5962555.1 hypothetical protein [Thiocystis minor]